MRTLVRPRWLWFTAAAVALVTSVVVASDLATLHRRVEAFGPQRPVVVATKDLALGATISATDVDVVRRHESQVGGEPLDDVDAAVGRIVAVPVLADAPLDARHLAPADRGAAGAVSAGMRAVRVVDESLLGAEPGARVDVLVALDPGLAAQYDVTTLVAASAATVLADSATPPPLDAIGGDTAGSVLLLVTAEEAERLAFASANGRVTLALVPPEDARAAAAPNGTRVR